MDNNSVALKVEIWKDVPGREGHYQVSSNGRVKTLRKTNKRNPGDILTAEAGSQAYPVVGMSINGTWTPVRIHRLVALAFLGEPKPGMTVNHINGDKKDNRLENLEYASCAENNIHAYRAGLRVGRAGAKLNSDAVREIRESCRSPQDYGHLSEKYGVSKRTIYSVVKRKVWANVA